MMSYQGGIDPMSWGSMSRNQAVEGDKEDGVRMSGTDSAHMRGASSAD